MILLYSLRRYTHILQTQIAILAEITILDANATNATIGANDTFGGNATFLGNAALDLAAILRFCECGSGQPGCDCRTASLRQEKIKITTHS